MINTNTQGDKPIIDIEDWKLVSGGSNPYIPPEARTIALCGEIGEHPDPRVRGNGFVITSPIMHVEGRLVYTMNSVYRLGDPDPEYLQWCYTYYGLDWVFDPDNPIQIIKTKEKEVH